MMLLKRSDQCNSTKNDLLSCFCLSFNAHILFCRLQRLVSKFIFFLSSINLRFLLRVLYRHLTLYNDAAVLL